MKRKIQERTAAAYRSAGALVAAEIDRRARLQPTQSEQDPWEVLDDIAGRLDAYAGDGDLSHMDPEEWREHDPVAWAVWRANVAIRSRLPPTESEDKYAESLAERIVLSLSESEPTEREDIGQEALVGTGAESCFVLESDKLRQGIAARLSDAFFDGEIHLQPTRPEGESEPAPQDSPGPELPEADGWLTPDFRFHVAPEKEHRTFGFPDGKRFVYGGPVVRPLVERAEKAERRIRELKSTAEEGWSRVQALESMIDIARTALAKAREIEDPTDE